MKAQLYSTLLNSPINLLNDTFCKVLVAAKQFVLHPLGLAVGARLNYNFNTGPAPSDSAEITNDCHGGAGSQNMTKGALFC